jgi:predicted esterase
MPFADLLRERNTVVLLPSSAGPTWALEPRTGGSDVARIDCALEATFDRCAVAPTVIACGGFSDGASYALSVGLANGDLFNALIAFSPGYLSPPARKGVPRIFIAHGTLDVVLPISATSRQFVPLLRSAGYPVEYREFACGHEVTYAEAGEAVAWFLGSASQGPRALRSRSSA